MKRLVPRPEFGKPETGLVRHWFRTDAQMRRNYMSPEERELERQRISERRRLAKKWRAEAEEFKRRASHRHFTCYDCTSGLNDIGAFDGHKDGERPSETDTRTCCACLAVVKVGKTLYQSKPGPNRHMYRCRVLNPDPVEDESEVAV